MIGVFDSGLGGVQSLMYLRDVLPDYDFLYVGDTMYVPYGTKEPDWIEGRTFACLEWMFGQGCELVILACNTASAVAVRSWQSQYPDRRVLSVTVPGVEALVESDFHRPLLLGTQRTVDDTIYQRVMSRAYDDYGIDWATYVGEGRVRSIESYSEGGGVAVLGDGEKELLQGRLQGRDCVVLGCTHYPLMMNELRDVFGCVPIINPAWESSRTLVRYLEKHKEIDTKLTRGGDVRLVVTGDEVAFGDKVEALFDWQINAENVLL